METGRQNARGHGRNDRAGDAAATAQPTVARAGRAPDARRLAAGAGRGAAATAAMSAVMLAATATGLAPMPEPVPAALVTRALGETPPPATIALASAAHLAYGALAGAVLAGLARRATVGLGAGYGAVLWAVMGLVWLPLAGWGLFGTAHTPRIAAATLVLHLVYGITLGLLLDRSATGTGRRR